MIQLTPYEFYENFANLYDANYNSPYWKISRIITWNYLRKYVPKNKALSYILDAGGGTGFWSIKLAKMGYRVCLLDISSAMLSIARDKITQSQLTNKIQIIRSDIVDMSSIKKERFDLVLAEGDPISYSSDPYKAITELARVTKSGGFISISVDNRVKWALKHIENKDNKVTEYFSKNATSIQENKDITLSPIKVFTIEELKKFFEENGIIPIESVGKMIFSDQLTNLDDNLFFKKALRFQLEFSSLPSVVGAGDHIALIGQKI